MTRSPYFRKNLGAKVGRSAQPAAKGDGVFANFYWLGLKAGSGLGWTPTAREGWAITVLSLMLLLVASLVMSRVLRFLIAVGVIALLMGTGLVSGTMPG